MTTDELNAQLEAAFAAVRNETPAISRLDKRLADKKARLSGLWDEYRYKTQQIQIEIGTIEKKIRLEETLLRGSLVRKIQSGQITTSNTNTNETEASP